MIQRILYLSLALFSVISCKKNSDNIITQTFSQIEGLIESDVDSALVVLGDLKTAIPTNNYNSSYYHLLLVEALSKTDKLSLEHDSIIESSVKYFSGKSLELHARAVIMKARLWTKLNQNKEAMTLYLKVLDTADDISDYTTLTRLYDDLGRLYLNEGLYEDALLMFRQIFVHDSIRNNKDNMVLSLANLASANLMMGSNDGHAYYIQKAYAMADVSTAPTKNRSYLDYFNSIALIELGNYDEALKAITSSINHHHASHDIYTKYMIKGEIYSCLNNYDSAHYFLHKCVISEDIYVRMLTFKHIYNLYRQQENLKMAFEYSDLYQEAMDSVYNLAYSTETKTLVYKYNMEKAVLINESKNRGILLIVVIFFSILVLVGVIRDKKIKLRTKEKEAEILKKQADILNKEKDIRSLKDKIETIKGNIGEYAQIKEKLTHYNELIVYKENELHDLIQQDLDEQCNKFKKTKIYYHITELSLQKKDANAKILSYIEQAELQEQIKKCFPRLLQELKKTYSKLTEEDLIFCCLALSNLSTYAISLCFSVSDTNAIKQRKFRIRKKMANNAENLILYNYIFPTNS